MNFDKFLRAVGMGLKAAAKSAAQRKAASPPKRKSVPVMTPDMLEPVGKALTRAETVKLYRAFVRDVVRMEREDVSSATENFSLRIQMLEEDLSNDVEYLAEEYRNVKELADDEMEDIRDEGHDKETLRLRLAEAEAPAIKAKADLTTAKDRLATFKANRRGYLVAYVNDEFHGIPMPDAIATR